MSIVFAGDHLAFAVHDDGHTRFGNFRNWNNGSLDAVG